MHPLFLHLIVFICLQILSPVFSDNPDGFERHISKGDAYYRSCDNANALLEYQQAYALAPDSLSTLLRMVRTYNDMGRLNFGVDPTSQTYYQKGVEYAQVMIRLYPNQAESHFWLALGRGSLIPFVGVGDKIRIGKEVQEEAWKALALDSTFSHAYIILAIFQREGAKLSWLEKTFVRIFFGHPISGSLEESERFLRVALALDRRNTFAMFEMYLTCSAMGRTDKAISALRSLCEIPPTNSREQQQRNESLDILKRIDSSKPE
jgi:tetratricopeptide (TPR) repeat protein